MVDILILIAGGIVLFALGFLFYFYVQSKRALRGDFGRTQMWAAELMQEDDEFAEAVRSLDEDTIIVAANISVTKQELRENVLKVYEEQD